MKEGFRSNIQLEWGCPNGTKYPRGNQFNSPSYARETILPNRARVYRRTYGQMDGQNDSSIPPNFVTGGGGGIISCGDDS